MRWAFLLSDLESCLRCMTQEQIKLAWSEVDVVFSKVAEQVGPLSGQVGGLQDAARTC